MKTKISRLSQIALLLTFFLPFFPKGCGGSSAEYEKEQRPKDSILVESIKHAESVHFVDSVLKVQPNANADSILNVRNIELAKIDSLRIKMFTDSIIHIDSIKALTDTISHKDNSTKLIPTEIFSKKSKLLRILLRPGDNNYTGVGYILDMFLAYLIYFGTWTAFLLFILGLVMKYKDFKNGFNPLNIIAWLFLLFTNPNNNVDNINLNFWEDKLWGYWFCLTFGLILIIYDSIILVKIRKNKTGA